MHGCAEIIIVTFTKIWYAFSSEDGKSTHLSQAFVCLILRTMFTKAFAVAKNSENL